MGASQREIESRIEALEEAIGLDTEEVIIHIRVVSSPLATGPDDRAEYLPLEEQIEINRQAGIKRMIVYSNA